jgi:hypothetical protein
MLRLSRGCQAKAALAAPAIDMAEHESSWIPSDAEELFAEALRSLGTDKDIDVDALCKDHPEHAEELRALAQNLSRLNATLVWQEPEIERASTVER